MSSRSLQIMVLNAAHNVKDLIISHEFMVLKAGSLLVPYGWAYISYVVAMKFFCCSPPVDINDPPQDAIDYKALLRICKFFISFINFHRTHKKKDGEKN